MKAKNLFAAICLAAFVALSGHANAQPPSSRATLTARAGAVAGTVRDGQDRALAGGRLRLRDAASGRIVMTARADQEGNFRFTGVPSGAYLVELVNEDGSVLAVGQTFPIAPAETVTTFVRLGARAPWYRGFFSNAALSAVSSAAGLGITAVGSGLQPASGRF
jgi:hypothetical protein